MIELGLVEDATKPNSIFQETWRNRLLQLALSELAFCRFYFNPFLLALFTEIGRWCFPLLPFPVCHCGCRPMAKEVQ